MPGFTEIHARVALAVGRLRQHASDSGLLRLRPKFLLSLVLLIAALTFGTLVIIEHSAEGQMQKSIEQDVNSVLTFENIRVQRQLELSRTAELISTLPALKATMADPQAADRGAAFDEIWHLNHADLLAVADWTGKIIVLHTSSAGFPMSTAQEMFAQSPSAGDDVSDREELIALRFSASAFRCLLANAI